MYVKQIMLIHPKSNFEILPLDLNGIPEVIKPEVYSVAGRSFLAFNSLLMFTATVQVLML